MPDKIDHEQSEISRSFNDNRLNRKEETITISPSLIEDSNNESSSSSLMSSTISLSSTMKNPSINNETTTVSKVPKSKVKKTKTRSRTNVSSSRPRNKVTKVTKVAKVVKDSSNKNGSYTIPYSTRYQTLQQQLRQQQQNNNNSETLNPSTIVNSKNNNTTESSTSTTATTTTTTTNNNVDSIPPQVPTLAGRKKYCAKCKESANIVKMINSKMSRIEELVTNLKKVTDESGMNYSQKSFTSFGGMDFSKMSMEDLQNFVMIITNAIMSSNTTGSSKSTDISSLNLNLVKMELEGSRSPQQDETSH